MTPAVNTTLGVFLEPDGRRLALAPLEVARFETFTEAEAWLAARGVAPDGEHIDTEEK
ncbi:MAG: hypothetical protein IT373_11985 [Polyangiaceae bacterium]|nr:hypothetical protein [Polyangiaceae bacterium]